MEVILYTTHCPRCKVLEVKMKEKNISYEEFDSVDRMLEQGIKTVPKLSVDGEVMDFAAALKWIKAVNIDA